MGKDSDPAPCQTVRLSDCKASINYGRGFLESGKGFLTSDRHSSEYSLWPTPPNLNEFT